MEKRDKNHIIMAIQALEIIYELDIQENKENLFCDFFRKFCEAQIISSGRLDNSKVYLFVSFIDVIYKVFGFKELSTEFELMDR